MDWDNTFLKEQESFDLEASNKVIIPFFDFPLTQYIFLTFNLLIPPSPSDTAVFSFST